MKQTGDLNLVKKINKSIVLDYLMKHSPVSRADVAKETGLTKATVSTLVQELLDESFLTEIGTGESSGGRKPVMLLFRQDAGYAIGVDLGVNYLSLVLTDLKGDVITTRRLPLRVAAAPSVDTVLSTLKKGLRELIDSAPASPYGIVGIGIGVPGITDDKGTVLFAPNLGWRDVPLQQMLEQEFGLPVTIDNEANAGAVGEKEFGVGASYANLVYISVGIGIGTGIVIRGELYRGTSGYSGEMGHMSVQADGTPCRCGNRGCWELYASESAILEEAGKIPDLQTLDFEEILSQANAGNPAAMKLFAQAGRYLGVGITNIINIFNPELIIIGNRFTEAAKWLQQPIQDAIDQRALPYHRESLQLKFAGLGTQSAVRGAAFLTVSRFFSERRVTVDYASRT